MLSSALPLPVGKVKASTVGSSALRKLSLSGPGSPFDANRRYDDKGQPRLSYGYAGHSGYGDGDVGDGCEEYNEEWSAGRPG